MEMQNQYTLNDVVTIVTKRFNDSDRQFTKVITTFTGRIDTIDKRLNKVDKRLDKVDKRLDILDRKIDQKFEEARAYTDQRLEAQTETIIATIDGVLHRVERLELSRHYK